MTPEQSVILAILICTAGAVLTLLVSRNKTAAGWLTFIFTAATAVVIISAVAHVLNSGPGRQHEFPILPQIGLVLRVYVDGLTAIFLLLAALISVPAALYSIVYMRNYEGYSVARYYPYFLLFLAAMYGLVSTTDMMWFFFIFWQMMTLPGYALIRFEHRNRANIRAANKFLIMMQIACAATMIGAELLAVTGAAASGSASLKYDFDTVSANLPLMLSAKPGATALAFALFLVGFGIKMGMWPFGQFWLPDAHPAAPSPVSAMLSGVMIKTGVYGLMRYFLWLVPPAGQADYPLAKWGLVVAAAGHHHAVHRHDAGAQAGAVQAPARLPQHRTDRLHPAGHRRVHEPAAGAGTQCRRARHDRPSSAHCSTFSTTGCSRPCCSSMPARCSTPPGRKTSTRWAA